IMAILVILISSDSLDKTVGSSPSRIILFGTILAVIPAETPTIPPVVPTLLHTSPFLCIDSSETSSDSFERPPLQDPYEVIGARWKSRVAVRSSPPSSPTHDLPPTNVTPPTLRPILSAPPELPHRPAILEESSSFTSRPSASRYLLDHSSSDHFSSDDSSLDSSSDYSPYSSSGHSLPYSSFNAPTTISTGPSHKRCRSPAAPVPLATPILGALSPMRDDLLPPRKRIKGADIDANTMVVDTAMTLEVGIEIEVDVEVEFGIQIEREEEVKEEADSKDRGTIEIGVNRVSNIESA
ncbi:hypothetical protein Tco_1007876, partial [Tanacetum coccineum]